MTPRLSTWHPAVERSFVDAQMERFLTAARSILESGGVDAHTWRKAGGVAQRLKPVDLEGPALADADIDRLAEQYDSAHGLVLFRLPVPSATEVHPLLRLAASLRARIDLRFPVRHPAEVGMPAGSEVVKIFDAGRAAGIAMSQQELVPHQDAIGNGGRICTVGLYVEQSPAVGGVTYFRNVLLLAVTLADLDADSLRPLFLPDALTVIARRGDRLLRVRGPVLYINESGRPQVFLRAADRDVQVVPRPESAAAIEHLTRAVSPEAPGALVCDLNSPGVGVIFDNAALVHGRTPFRDSALGRHRRTLARKWWASVEEATEYQSYPALAVEPEFRSTLPDIFGDHLLQGTWMYDPDADIDIRES
ncbi:MAG TPA: TauD/TfdA family dioxygenase [Micromonosporaceae bacterium]|jgi:hypothetical protein